MVMQVNIGNKVNEPHGAWRQENYGQNRNLRIEWLDLFTGIRRIKKKLFEKLGFLSTLSLSSPSFLIFQFLS
jgi:hypothetical protein